MSFRLFRLAPLALAIASGIAQAETASIDLDTISVVSASGHEQKVTDAPASVSVITREELQTRRYGNLAEALENVEGIDVRGNTGKTGGLNISIRGMPAEYTLVLIDGRRQNAAGNVAPNGFGETSTGFIPPVSAIERIEVIRGPMSTLHGSDAMGGVINIITRKVADSWTGSIGHELTIQEEREFGGTSGTNFYTSGPLIEDRLGLMVRGSVFSRDESELEPTGDADAGDAELNTRGQSPVEGRIHTFGTRLTLTPDQDHELWLELDTARQVYDNGSWDDRKLSRNDSPTQYRGYDDELRFIRDQAAIGHNAFLEQGRLESSLMWNRTETLGRGIPGDPTDPTDSGIPGKLVGDARELENENLVFDTRFTTLLNNDHYVTVGGQWWEAEMVDGVAAEQFEQTLWALFVEDEWQLRDDLALTLGVRHDQHDAFGGQLSPRAYAVWSMDDAWTLKGGVASGFRAPHVDQLHDGITGISGQGTIATVGNPELEPETSISPELGVYYNGLDGLSANATVFYNEFDDKITSVADRYNCNYDGSGADPQLTPAPADCYNLAGFDGQAWVPWNDNVDEATTRGIELAARVPLAPRWSLSANYTFTESEIRVNGDDAGDLADTPRHSAHTRVSWEQSDRLTLWLGADYRGESRRFNGRSGDLTGQDRALYDAVGDLEDYLLFDLGGSWQANENLTLSARIENLANKDFRDFTAYEYNGDTYYASEYSHFTRSTKGAILEGRRLWLSATVTF